ncbi:MAG: transposase, partial [Phycisphaerae bacterium]|nr:transposase [Phycisphaerae bacterium]
MPEYRRAFVPGGTFFFTLVAARRRPILTTPAARQALRTALADAART